MTGAKEVLNDPQYSPGQTVETTVDDGNLRSLPGTGQSIAASLPNAEIMHVVEGPTSVSGYTWYKLSGSRGTGWMASSLFKASTAAPPVGQFKVNQSVQVDTDYLNIRQAPSIRSPANATVPYGTKGAVIEGPKPTGGYRWYRLDTDYGRGWAVEQYLVLEGQAKPRTRFMVGDAVAVDDQDGLRLRTAAGLGTKVLGTLPNGSKGVVVGGARVVDSITWVEIQTALGTGWVGEEYLSASDDGPAESAKFERGDSVKVNTDSVNLREAAGTSRPVIRVLGNGITGTVIDPPSAASNMWWARIDTDYGSGWVAEAFLAGVEDADSGSVREFSTGDNVYVDTDGINIRVSPSTSAKVVTILHQNEQGKIVDGPESSDGYVWYKIETSTNTGWGVSRYLGMGTADPGGGSGIKVGDVVAVDTDGINLRQTPGLTGPRLKVIHTDEQATVIDGPTKVDGYTWFKLRANSDEGWAVSHFLRLETGSGISAGGTARVIDGDLNLRSGAGTDRSIIGVLADGAFVDVLEGPTTAGGYDWMKVKSSRFGSGWCVAEFLSPI
jgi:uncharacterized protein YgiM (DUF1202 family)